MPFLPEKVMGRKGCKNWKDRRKLRTFAGVFFINFPDFLDQFHTDSTRGVCGTTVMGASAEKPCRIGLFSMPPVFSKRRKRKSARFSECRKRQKAVSLHSPKSKKPVFSPRCQRKDPVISILSAAIRQQEKAVVSHPGKTQPYCRNSEAILCFCLRDTLTPSSYQIPNRCCNAKRFRILYRVRFFPERRYMGEGGGDFRPCSFPFSLRL